MSNKYCSVRFKTGEELDKALEAALCSCDDAARAEAAAGRAEVAMNETEKMYVTNRTHWEEVISEGGNVFPSTSISFKSSLGAISGLGKDQIVVGRKYVVTWNGMAYDCTAFLLYESSEDSAALGNSSLLGEGTDTGEPFCLSDFISSGCAVTKATTTAESITVQIDAVREVIIHHLDPKYIKDMHHETKEIVEILPEITLTEDNAVEIVTSLPSLGLVEGSSYIVTVNGQEYICTAWAAQSDGYDMIGLGDGSSWGAPSNGEPFFVQDFPPETAAIVNSNVYFGATSNELKYPITASIKAEQTTIVPLPTKYLPDGVPYVEGEVVEILPETTFSLMHQDGIDSTFKDGLLGLVAGEKYKAVYNGVEYECAAEIFTVEGGTVIGFGNLTGLGAEHNTGEPFGVADIKSSYGNNWFVGDYTGSSVELENGSMSSVEVTVSIKQGEITVRKIDPRCLPDGVPYVESGVVEILPDYTITEENAEADMAGIPALGLVAGNTYIVTLNGVEYTCVAWAMTQEGMTAVGLGDIYTASNGNLGTAATGEPFVMIEYPPEVAAELGANVMVEPLSEDIVPPVTFSIKGDGATIRKLDSRCLDLAWLPVVDRTEVDVFPETDISSWTNIGAFYYDFNAEKKPIGLEDGVTYRVIWDGVAYDCVATITEMGSGSTYNKAVTVGSAAVSTGVSDGIPFSIWDVIEHGGADAMDERLHVCTLNGSKEHTFSISKIELTPNKMPNEFLDLEWLPTKEKTVKIEKMSVNCSMNVGGIMCAIITSGIDTKQFISMVGQDVEFVVDGVSYACTVKERIHDRPETVLVEREVYVGNAGLGNSSVENTGEPFFFTVDISMDGDVAIFGCGTVPGVHTIEMYGDFKPNKLPNEFLDLVWLPTVGRVQVLPKQTVTVAIADGEVNGYASTSGLVTEGLEKGTPVKAIINGITYDTTLTNDLDVTGFACAEIPCIFTVAPRTGFVAYKSGTYTIELYAEVGVNKLPAEFLPDDATELHLTSSGGKKFKITVSDDGALSAVEATA